PRIVKSSGSPAATSEPKASTMIAIVTGQDRNSDFIIALRLALLKSFHMPEEPVSETATDPAPAAFSDGSSDSAAATISVVPPAAPAITTAVCPSGAKRGGCTDATRRSAARTRATRASVCRNSGEEAGTAGECTTTVSAELDRPPKLC